MKAVLTFLLYSVLLAQGSSHRLINGEPANLADWPASIKPAIGTSWCSGTLIGPRVLFTAAHCVKTNLEARFSINGELYTSYCTKAPDYVGNYTADWALCLVDKEVQGVKFENLDVDGSSLRVGDELRLTGYGCTSNFSGSDGIFRTGFAKITKLPKGTNYDIVTRGGSALCFGDSGGGVYKEESNGRRVVVAVNSRGDISTVSWLPSVTTAHARDFIRIWAYNNKAPICGVNLEATNCR